MKDHELKVKQISTGAVFTVSKCYYWKHESELDIVEGEPGDAPDEKETQSFTAPTIPDTKFQDKEDKLKEKPKAKPKTPAKPKVEPPKVS